MDKRSSQPRQLVEFGTIQDWRDISNLLLSNELNCRHVVPGFLPGFQRLVQRHLRKCFNFAGDFETSKDVSLLHPVYHIDDIRHLKMTNTKEGAAKAGLDELLDENIQRQVE